MFPPNDIASTAVELINRLKARSTREKSDRALTADLNFNQDRASSADTRFRSLHVILLGYTEKLASKCYQLSTAE